MSVSWDPGQYGLYGDERERPGLDLIARVPLAAPASVVDLGCGAGGLTRRLAARWPDAAVTGIDSSPAMLAKARAGASPIVWRRGDIVEWRPESAVDLIYSNAVLHWLDDHRRLFPRLMEALAPGGVLAVQMPRNHGAPSHVAMTEAARAGPWRDRLEPVLRTSPVAEPAVYYDSLAPRAARLEIWETAYLHVLDGDDPVVEWTRGSALRPLLAALDDDHRDAFLADYRARVARHYPRRADGRTLFPFKRLFLIAIR